MIIKPLWSDSLGAKSFSTYIEASGKRIIIDPGVAVMQRSYPIDKKFLIEWYMEAYDLIKSHLELSDIVIITHYHHDHYLWKEEDIPLYSNKTLLIKNPNQYINDSQWKRARNFIGLYASQMLNTRLEEMMYSPVEKNFPDYVESYKLALSKDYGDYAERRCELLDKGRTWFLQRAKKWLEGKWVRETESGNNKMLFIDGKTIWVDDVEISFTPPLYHGIEYSRTGWVIGLSIKYLGKRLVYTSDIQGPIIEDYVSWILREDPEIIFLDGPPTYLIPYMLNLINFRRALENIRRIIEYARSLKLIIYDHHLTRDINFYEKVGEVFQYAKNFGVEILDVATYLGREPAYSKVKNYNRGSGPFFR